MLENSGNFKQLSLVSFSFLLQVQYIRLEADYSSRVVRSIRSPSCIIEQEHVLYGKCLEEWRRVVIWLRSCPYAYTCIWILLAGWYYFLHIFLLKVNNIINSLHCADIKTKPSLGTSIIQVKNTKYSV